MIAPSNFTNHLKLYLYITDHMVSHFGLKSKSLSKGSDLDLPRDWWSVWRCEVLITDPEGEHNVLLFTNEGTLLSFICPGFGNDFDGLIESFEIRFLAHLEANGAKPPEGASITTVLMTDEPEELSDFAWWLVDCVKKDLIERKLDVVEAEIRVNTLPASEMGGESPMEYFLEEFERSRPFGTEL